MLSLPHQIRVRLLEYFIAAGRSPPACVRHTFGRRRTHAPPTAAAPSGDSPVSMFESHAGR